MKPFAPFLVVVAFVLGACAFVPKTNLRLEEARAIHTAAMADARLRELATAEIDRASQVFEEAQSAWNTLQDPAVVDHLAYLAKQRVAIAQETARLAAAQAVVTQSLAASSGASREIRLRPLASR